VWEEVRSLDARYLGRFRLKVLLIVGLGFLGFPALLAPITLGLVALTSSLPPEELEEVVLAAANGSAGSPMVWALAKLLLSALAGFPLLIAAAAFMVRRDRPAVELAYFSLLSYLTVVNLLVFYFDQFQAIGGAILQFILLRGVIYYRQRYLREPQA